MGNINKIQDSDLIWQLQQQRLRSANTEKNTDESEEVKNESSSTQVFSSGDSVRLSLAKTINEEFNTDNTSKVEALKAQIANGTYKPDLMSVASAFVNTIEDEIAVEKLGNA